MSADGNLALPTAANAAASGSERVGAHRGLERARLAAAMGKWSTALALLQESLLALPDEPAMLGLYGYCLARAGADLETARSACSRAVDMQPFAAHQHAYLGQVYLSAGLARAAADCFQVALQLDPLQSVARAGLDACSTRSRPARWRAWLGRFARRSARPRPG